MTTNNTPDIDARLLSGLSGSDKLKLLMKEQAGTLADWARERGIDPIELHHCLAARRLYPEHRQKIADGLGLDREQVGAMIGPVGDAEVA